MSYKTVDAFVLSNAPNLKAYFAYSNQVSRDLIISYAYVRTNEDILGKWIRAVVRDQNSVCQTIVIIDDIFETRIIDRIPEIKIEAFYDGRFENKWNIFFNNYVGPIFDDSHIIRNVEKNRSYPIWINRLPGQRTIARWRISKGHSNNLRTVDAIVHSLTLDENRYIAWSREEQRDKICFDVDKSLSSKNLIGRWIEATIDNRNRVVGSVKIIPDVFETRMRYGTTEIRGNFETTDDNSEMFYSSYFGNIYDPKQMVTQLQRDSWYKGWIVFFFKQGIDTRWRLSREQVVEGPFTIERNVYKNYDNNRRYSWNDIDENPNISQSLAPQSTRNYDRPSHRDRNSPSPEVFTSSIRDSSYEKEDFDRYSTKSISSNGSKQTRDHQVRNSRDPSTTDSALGSMNERREMDQFHDDRADLLTRGDSPNLYQKNNREGSSNEKNRELFALSAETSIDMNGTNRLDKEKNHIHYKKASATVQDNSDNFFSDSSYMSPEHNKPRKTENFRKNAADIDRDAHSSSTNSDSHSKKTQEENNLLRLKSDLAQMCRLVQSLTKDCSVSDYMKLANFEDYEELMELTNSK